MFQVNIQELDSKYNSNMLLYTIGHSAHPIQKFISLLKAYQIQVLVDVRSIPASRFHPQYNKAALQKVLIENQMGYVFAGLQLGGRPNDPTCYEPGTFIERGTKHPRANFSEIMKRDWFVQGIADLVGQVNRGRTVILCSEEDPLRCHRHELIAKFLREAYPSIEVQHMRGNGTLVSAADLFNANEKQPPEQLSFL
jgi:uncharacterized protein (DUF488 family)